MTTITIDSAAIGRGAAAELPPLSVILTPGAPNAIAVETDERPMLLSLLIGGRMRPSAGLVAIDGGRELRRVVALVDTPFVAEPVPSVSLRGAVREELAFARRRTGRAHVEAAIARLGASDWADAPVQALPTAERIRILVELALARPGVEAIVLTSPERHGGDPAEWYPALTGREATIVVVTDAPTRDRLVRLGARDALAASLPVEGR
ncbi:MAG: hypothetical protein QM635_02610 [Microbacteriaceae bacterium]